MAGVFSTTVDSIVYSPEFNCLLSFAEFVERVLRYSDVAVATVLVAMIYIDRAKDMIRIVYPLDQRRLELVLTGALIIASKVGSVFFDMVSRSHGLLKILQDENYRTRTWSQISGVFSTQQLIVIERVFLKALDYTLGVEEGEVLRYCSNISCYSWLSRVVIDFQSYIDGSSDVNDEERDTDGKMERGIGVSYDTEDSLSRLSPARAGYDCTAGDLMF